MTLDKTRRMLRENPRARRPDGGIPYRRYVRYRYVCASCGWVLIGSTNKNRSIARTNLLDKVDQLDAAQARHLEHRPDCCGVERVEDDVVAVCADCGWKSPAANTGDELTALIDGHRCPGFTR